ncbi:MAG: outer membrane lipid asymmetry maintenance protein MlaD [Parvularculaceae bacterium]
MSKGRAFETLVGVLVVAVAAAFLYYAYNISGRSGSASATSLSAVFGRVDGVTVGSEVRIAGVKVGAVTSYDLDPQTYEARVKMAIDPNIAVPDDSVAKIVSNGILGGSHIAIEPGASEDMLADNGTIYITQGSVDLLGLAMQAFTSNTGGDGADAASGDADALSGGLGDVE